MKRLFKIIRTRRHWRKHVEGGQDRQKNDDENHEWTIEGNEQNRGCVIVTRDGILIQKLHWPLIIRRINNSSYSYVRQHRWRTLLGGPSNSWASLRIMKKVSEVRRKFIVSIMKHIKLKI